MSEESRMIHKSKRNLIHDDTLIWFGKHKGTKMSELPYRYLQWLSENSFKAIKKYCKDRNITQDIEPDFEMIHGDDWGIK